DYYCSTWDDSLRSVSF
nr:immunoglobulin light chain junction region [Macaca mulatta]